MTVLRCDAGINSRHRLDVLDIVVVVRLIVEVFTLIVLEVGRVVRVIDLAVEDREHLILALFETGIEIHDLVFVVIILVIILGEITEHRAVEHMMTVDQIVVAIGIAVRVHEQLAAFGIVAVKVLVQVFFRIVGRIHDRIVDDGVVDLQPAEEVMVLGVQLFIVTGELLQFGMSLFIGVRVEELDADDDSADQKHDDRNHSDDDDRRTGALFRSSAATIAAVIITAARSSVAVIAIIVAAASAVIAALRALLTTSAVIVIALTTSVVIALTLGILLTASAVVALLTLGILLTGPAVIALALGILLTTSGIVALTLGILLASSAVIALLLARALIGVAADVVVAGVGISVAACSSAVVIVRS